MKLTNCSKHICQDHVERTAEILMTVGLGKEVYRRRYVDRWGRDSIRALTNTGIMICYAPDTELVITLFIATAKQVRELYQMSHCPDYIYSTIKRNEKRFKHLIYSTVYQEVCTHG